MNRDFPDFSSRLSSLLTLSVVAFRTLAFFSGIAWSMYLGLRCDVESRSRPNLDGDLVNCGVPEVFAIGVFRVTAVRSMDFLCLTAMSKFFLTPDKIKIMLKLLSVESFNLSCSPFRELQEANSL